MNTNHSVPTRAIQEAVKGREQNFLDALAIDWRASHPHITRPYPRHDDSSRRWRWDDTKARACTCTQGSHSSLAVVTAKGDVDFEAAKVLAAKLAAVTAQPHSGTQDA